MAEKEFFIELDENTRIFVWFVLHRRKVKDFVVKLIHKGLEIVRYDSAHGCPHKDILHPDPHLKRKIWYHGLDNDVVLTLAINELKQEYPQLVERYLKWLVKEKPQDKE